MTAADRHADPIAEATYDKQARTRPVFVTLGVHATRLTVPDKRYLPSQRLELRYASRKPQVLWGRFEGRSSRFGIEEDLRIDIPTSTFLKLFQAQPTSIAVGKQACALDKEARVKLGAFVDSLMRLRSGR